MSAGDRIVQEGVEGNPLSKIEQLEREFAILKTQVLKLTSLDSAVNTIGIVNDADFGSAQINDEGMRTKASLVDIDYWQAINLSDDDITQIKTVVLRTIAGVRYLYVGGTFSRIGGIEAHGIARYNFDIRDWETVGNSLQGGWVYSIAFDSSDNLFIGGFFVNAGGDSAADYIAQLISDKWANVGSGVNNVVNKVAIDSADNVYIGGQFTNAGGDAAADYFAKLVAGAWVHVGGTLNAQVFDIDFDSADIPYIVGAFTNAGGDAAVDYAAMLSGGTTWVNVGGVLNNEVYTIVINSKDKPIIGGLFTSANGDAQADYMAELSDSGWVHVGNGGFDQAVYAIVLDPDDRPYAFGTFTAAGEVTDIGYAAFLKDDVWTQLDTGVNDFVWCAAFDDVDKSVYVGGDFTKAGAVICRQIAVYTRPLSNALDQIASLFELYDARNINRGRTVIAAFEPMEYIHNTVAETDLFDPNAPIVINNLDDCFAVIVTIEGRLYNNTGGNQTVTPKIQFDGITVGATVPLTVGTNTAALNLKMEFLIYASPNKSHSVSVLEIIWANANQLARSTMETNVVSIQNDKEVTATLTFGAANAALNFLCTKVFAERIPKNIGNRVSTFFTQNSSGGDVFIRSDTPTVNSSASATLAVGENNAGAIVVRTLIKPPFLTDIPSNAVIVSAQLGVVVSGDVSSNARDFKVHRLLINYILAQVTWNNSSAGNPWNTAGAGGSGTDYDPTVLATTNFSATEAVGTLKIFDLLPAEIQKIVDGTYSYYGFLIMADTETNDQYNFYSSRNGAEYLCPWMRVTYYVP